MAPIRTCDFLEIRIRQILALCTMLPSTCKILDSFLDARRFICVFAEMDYSFYVSCNAIISFLFFLPFIEYNHSFLPIQKRYIFLRPISSQWALFSWLAKSRDLPDPKTILVGPCLALGPPFLEVQKRTTVLSCLCSGLVGRLKALDRGLEGPTLSCGPSSPPTTKGPGCRKGCPTARLCLVLELEGFMRSVWAWYWRS